MVLRPFTRHNFKHLAVYSSCECLLSKATGMVTHIVRILEKVVLYLLAKVYNSHNCYIYTFRKGLKFFSCVALLMLGSF